MINSGTEDIHIDPYTHTNEYSSEPLVAVNQQLVHYASYLVSSFVLFSRFHVPASL